MARTPTDLQTEILRLVQRIREIESDLQSMRDRLNSLLAELAREENTTTS